MKFNETKHFKIRWRTEAGLLQGTGSCDGDALELVDTKILIDSILVMYVDGDNFLLSWLDGNEQQQTFEFEVFAIPARELARLINAGRSDAMAAREKSRLIEEGNLDSYDDQICPFCESTILLLDLPNTPQVYCQYCETLFSRERTAPNDLERHFRICEGCNMYSRPRQFSTFYFYFLVVTFGVHHNTLIRCSACMRKSAWKMMFVNLFGVLGLPFAFIQLRRSYSTRGLAGMFEGLDSANALAGRKKVELALDKYDRVMDRVPVNAGVKFNVARGLMLQQDFAHAQQMFEMSLDDCANYWPSVMGLVESLEKLGDEQKLVATRKFWKLD